ncbi:hypothetical protein ACEUAI_13075 [Aeromonas veronii]|uniref:hypothetical protein n=1 Tax=Aeromonas hydrophila TaxID=644 RepID=UPI002B48AFE4|nr:hypothetical protein [Aeromonas hydrophila]
MTESEFNYHYENSNLKPCFLAPTPELMDRQLVAIYSGERLVLTFLTKDIDDGIAKAIELINNALFIRIMKALSYSEVLSYRVVDGINLSWPDVCCGLKQRDIIKLDLSYQPGELLLIIHIEKAESLAMFLTLTPEASEIIYPEGRFFAKFKIPNTNNLPNSHLN